jgi:hypothetical protein
VFDATGRLVLELRSAATELVIAPDAIGLLTIAVEEGGRRNSMQVMHTGSVPVQTFPTGRGSGLHRVGSTRRSLPESQGR